MINLSRTVEVRCVDVAATVAVEQERPEFLAIIQLAKHLGGEVNPQQVQRELFEPLPEQACRLALERCVALQMLEWDGPVARVTELGQLAVGTERVLVPEQGVWRFHLVDDPLVPHPVVHAERRKTEPAHKFLTKPKREGLEFRGHSPTPALLRNSVHATPQRSLVDHKHSQLWDVGAQCQPAGKADARLDLFWTDDGSNPTVRLTGELPESQNRLDGLTEADFSAWTFDKLWLELAATAVGVTAEEMSELRRRHGERAVPMSFDALEPASRKTFLKDVQVPNISFPDIGAFQPSTLSQVHVFPATDRDAQDWCEWLQWSEITGYVTPDILGTQAAGILARFPHHQPGPLEPEALRASALKNDNLSVVRHVLAPADLGLWS